MRLGLALAVWMRHNAGVFGQHPESAAVTVASPAGEVLLQLQAIGWVDRTALAVLVVFFAIGVFQGLIWQISRVGILVAAYVLSGRYGQQVAAWFTQAPGLGAGQSLVPEPVLADPAAFEQAKVAAEAAATMPAGVAGPTLYLAYVLVFLVVLVGLSLLAIALQRAARRVGLGFFDRLGGGIAGVAAGAGVVLFGLFVVHMFFQGSELAAAARSSHSLRWCKRAIDLLGPSVPDDLREVIALVPLRSSGLQLPQQGGSAQPVPAVWPPANPPIPSPGAGQPPR